MRALLVIFSVALVAMGAWILGGIVAMPDTQEDEEKRESEALFI